MKILVVSKFPLSQKYQVILDLPDDVDVSYLGVSKNEAGEELTGIKDRRAFFTWFMNEQGIWPDGILALGNEGLQAVTGHSGIMKYRGRDLTWSQHLPVMASVSPGAVERTPSQAALLKADVQGLIRKLSGEVLEGVEPSHWYYVQRFEFAQLLSALDKAEEFAFDLETSGYDETEKGAFIVSIALTLDDGSCWAVPLCHKDAPWLGDQWIVKLQQLAQRMRKVPIRIGHNAKFDCRWLEQFDAPVPCNFDTMLAAHVLDENRSKGLKPLARMLLGAPEWDIHIKAGKNDPPWYEQQTLSDILHYNALDTWHTFNLFKLFQSQLDKNPKLSKIFRYIMMPASQSLVHIERHGISVDQQRLVGRAEQCRQEIAKTEMSLLMYLPDKVPHKINWNPTNFLKWFLFDHLGLPVIKHTDKGAISVDSEVMQRLSEIHPAAKLLETRAHWEKLRSTYFSPYLELLTPDSRLHTTFKLTGTVTGRMSSGKADEEKVTGAKNIRGVNAQQVPRNVLLRSIFNAPEGWKRVDADYSQLEMRLAAEIAQEQHMIDMYLRGEDLHMNMAIKMTGKTRDKITKKDRYGAKPVNFGFLYAMQWETFIDQAYRDYNLTFTEEEAKNARALFFQEYPGLRIYHSRQKQLARKYKRVQTPIGRIRHLPDIDSPSEPIRRMAERQAINSPIQGMGSDLCLISINTLHRLFRRQNRRTVITNNVHDSIGLEVPNDELEEVLPIIKSVMENPPLERMFGYRMTVPLVADISVGTHWGEQEEINV